MIVYVIGGLVLGTLATLSMLLFLGRESEDAGEEEQPEDEEDSSGDFPWLPPSSPWRMNSENDS